MSELVDEATTQLLAAALSQPPATSAPVTVVVVAGPSAGLHGGNVTKAAQASGISVSHAGHGVDGIRLRRYCPASFRTFAPSGGLP